MSWCGAARAMEARDAGPGLISSNRISNSDTDEQPDSAARVGTIDPIDNNRPGAARFVRVLRIVSGPGIDHWGRLLACRQELSAWGAQVCLAGDLAFGGYRC